MSKWEEKELQDVCYKITDGTHQTPTYFDNGYIFLSSKNVTSQKIDWDNVKYVDEEQYIKFQKRIAPKIGDILLAKNGTTGVAAMVDRDVKFNIYVSLAWLRTKGKVIPEYLLYFINSENAKQQFNRRLKGAGIPNLHLKEIKEVLIPFPKSLPEQRRIVAKLDGLFAEIDGALAKIESNIQTAEDLMGSFLDKEFTKLEQVSTVYKIQDIATIKGGKRLPKGEKLVNKETEYPYVRVADFNDKGSIDLENIKYITEDIYSKISRYTINTEDLYISIAGTIGKTGIIPSEINGANLTENAAKLVFKKPNEVFNEFVYYYTLSDKFSSYVNNATKQVAQPKLALKRLREIRVALPSKIEQEHLTKQFKKMEEYTFNLKQDYIQKRDDLEALKSSLLDRAFKGEL